MPTGAPVPILRYGLINLGGVFSLEGRSEEAMTQVRRALAVREQALGPNHPEVGRVLINLCSDLGDLERYAEAEACCARALALLGPLHPDGHPELAVAITTVGELLVAQGRHRDALSRVEAALLWRRPGSDPVAALQRIHLFPL